jgi:hypothetical protein
MPVKFKSANAFELKVEKVVRALFVGKIVENFSMSRRRREIPEKIHG